MIGGKEDRADIRFEDSRMQAKREQPVLLVSIAQRKFLGMQNVRQFTHAVSRTSAQASTFAALGEDDSFFRSQLGVVVTAYIHDSHGTLRGDLDGGEKKRKEETRE